MPRGIPTDPKIKAEVLETIRKEGMTAYETSKVFGINDWTISGWLRSETKGSEKNYISQINQLKKKLDNAYRVIGRLRTKVMRRQNS